MKMRLTKLSLTQPLISEYLQDQYIGQRTWDQEDLDSVKLKWLALSQEQFGVWTALAIHATSSVVATAAIYGDEAATVATTVKLPPSSTLRAEPKKRLGFSIVRASMPPDRIRPEPF